MGSACSSSRQGRVRASLDSGSSPSTAGLAAAGNLSIAWVRSSATLPLPRSVGLGVAEVLRDFDRIGRSSRSSQGAISCQKSASMEEQHYAPAATSTFWFPRLIFLAPKPFSPRMDSPPGAADDYHRPWHRATTTVELHHDVENPLAFDFHVEGSLTQCSARHASMGSPAGNCRSQRMNCSFFASTRHVTASNVSI